MTKFLGNIAASINIKRVMLNKQNNFFENCYWWSAINGLETRYGSGTGSETGTVMCQKSEPEPEQEPELFKSQNRNRKK